MELKRPGPLQTARALDIRGRENERHFKLCFERPVTAINKPASYFAAFLLTVLLILTCTGTGMVSGFSNSGLLFINTGITVLASLKFFILQQGQAKDSLATQFNLYELIAGRKDIVRDRIIPVHDRFQTALNKLKNYCSLFPDPSRKIIVHHNFCPAKKVEGISVAKKLFQEKVIQNKQQ